MCASAAPDGEQHALALVVTGAMSVGLIEVTSHNRPVDSRHDLGETDFGAYKEIHYFFIFSLIGE